MNYYGRRRYRRRYYTRSRRGVGTYTSRSKRRAIGNYRAAIQQKDSTQVNLNIQHKCSTSFRGVLIPGEGGAVRHQFKAGVYAVNVWDLLRKSEFYQSYANMYDQVKIDRIKIKLTPIQWTFNNNGANTFQAITVITAWDRTGLSENQVKIITDDVATQGDNANIVGLAQEANNDGLYVVMNDEIGSYSSAMTRNLNPGSSLSISRVLYPSSLAEKSFWANTADLDQWYASYDVMKCRYIGFEDDGNVYGGAIDPEIIAQHKIGELRKTDAAVNNPCFLLEDSTIPFKPTFLLGVQTGISNNYIGYHEDEQTNDIPSPPVLFNMEADVGVTFRGLRKAKIVE